MDTHDATRRRVLSAAGTAIVGGLFTTGSAGADVTRGYSTDLRGPTAAGATAYITVEDGEANYSLWVVCIRNATHVTFTIDQKPYLEFELEGDVTRGLVTREVVLEGTLTDRRLIDALDDGRAGAIVHTEQCPRGELHGPFIPDELGTIDLDDPPRERDEDDADEPTDDDDDTAGRLLLITVTDAVTGEPVAGAEVQMFSADGDPADAVEFTFTTDADGRVEENVEIGNLTLYITADGYEDYGAEMSLETEHHAELIPEDTDPNEEHSVTFTVVNLLTGESVDGGEVILTNLDTGATVTMPNEGGIASTTVTTGTYRIDIDIENYILPDELNQTLVTVADDTELELSVWRELEGVTLIATVLNAETGEPIEGAQISGFGAAPTYDPLFAGITGPDGVAEINAENTRWEVDITAEGYEFFFEPELDLRNQAGETVEVTFEMQPSAPGEPGEPDDPGDGGQDDQTDEDGTEPTDPGDDTTGPSDSDDTDDGQASEDGQASDLGSDPSDEEAPEPGNDTDGSEID